MRAPAAAATALLVVLMGIMAVPASADQNDPRLGELFSQLRVSADFGEARALEGRIWSIWLSNPDQDVAYALSQGVVAMNAGQVDEAIEQFDKVIQQAPDFAEGWNKRATALYLREDFAASMRDIQRTLALEPRHFGAISGMGLILMATGDRLGALAAFEAVLRIHPNARGARLHLEQLRRELSRGGA